MSVLLTGSTGFIGSHLARALQSEGYEVACLSRNGGGNSIKGDVASPDLQRILPKDIEAIFNLAADISPEASPKTIEQMLHTNILGVANLLDFSLKNEIGRFIQSSSCSIYPRTPKGTPLTEDCLISPQSAYGATKFCAESMCEIYQTNYGLSSICLRYSSVYGYGQKSGSVLPSMIKDATTKGEIKVMGSGRRTQDFVYVKDVVRANLLALKSKSVGAHNIGGGAETSMSSLAKAICAVFHESSPRITYVPGKGDETRFLLDISKAKENIGYVPEYSLNSALLEYKKEIISKGDLAV